MTSALISPAKFWFLGFVPGWFLFLLIPAIATGIFAYIIAKRIAPIYLASPDNRFDRIPQRLFKLLTIWLGQIKQPRYMLAGVLHIIIFAGFLILSIRSTSLVIIGISEDFVVPGFSGSLGHMYNFIKDYAATFVLISCVIAAIRRGYYKPERYSVPEKYGKDHTLEAIFVLSLISLLMLSESLFEASLMAANTQKQLAVEFVAPLSLVWLFKAVLSSASLKSLQNIHLIAYITHEITFFFFLCFLPQGKHFHVITSVFNVFFMKLDKGSIKPVKWDVPEDKLDEVKSFGVKKITDFTWKHILDFYSCADCGRCSDQCPANAVKRPLSPRFISIKARDYIFKHYPIKGEFVKNENLIGSIYTEDEIWSCTTCGACEEECPIALEYIDKIVDLRRGMIDDGLVPQSLQKPLNALSKRGNPYGKMEKKRAEWTKTANCEVKVFDNGDSFEMLYFVDSVTSYDDRIQEIGKATARILSAGGEDFGVLGKSEKDSGHEVKRFGEEMLFQTLKTDNTEAILETKAKKIVTSDPHAYNALKKDYKNLPPVFHISEVALELVKSGKIKLKGVESQDNLIFTYHDPCYLGRHNGLYNAPRELLDSVPNLKRIEMQKCKDRSFCCGGGGLMLFYEPTEEQRMGQIRVKMAHEAGANVIVTACPFCMANIEDAIKTSGLEGKMQAIDLAELIDKQIVKE